MHLNDLTIKALKPPPKGAKTYFDTSLAGFGVRVSEGGTKTFILLHGRQRKRTTIGRVGIITLKAARTAAKEILAERTLGKRELPMISFEKALQTFLKQHEAAVKDSTYSTDKRLLEKHFLPKFRHDKLCDILTHQISEILDKLGHVPAEGRHAFASIRLFMRWATRRNYLDRSPIERLQSPSKSPTRSRVLSDEELKAVLKVCTQTTTFSHIVYLLLLTGQRVNQIASLRGEWIDREAKTITFPGAIMKGNREHTIPYGTLVQDILRALPLTGLLFPARARETKFNGFSKCKADFDKECGVTDWTLHDLRRTLRTNLAALKVPREHAERILDHRSAVATDVEAIYDRHTYLPEMRDALQKWQDKVQSLVPEGNP